MYYNTKQMPCHVVQWSNHLGAMCVTFAVTEDRFEPRLVRVRLLKRIISNNSYAHDDQGDKPGQENRGVDGVLYKL